jgi:hypothetical protein
MVMRFNGDGSLEGLTPLTGLQPGIVANNNIAVGAITQTLPAWNSRTLMFTGNNAGGSFNQFTNFTLTETQAPIGSYVIMEVGTYSGNSGGSQKCYLTQATSGGPTNGPSVTTWSERLQSWGYWGDVDRAIFPIVNSASRTFYVEHGTVSATNSNDFRVVYYLGFISIID